MKKSQPRFEWGYLFLLGFDILILIGQILVSAFFDGNGDRLLFSNSDLYFIKVIPLYSIVRGAFSYLLSKKVWFPNILYLLTFWIGLPFESAIAYYLKTGILTMNIQYFIASPFLIFSAVYFIISLIASLLCFCGYNGIRKLKQAMQE